MSDKPLEVVARTVELPAEQSIERLMQSAIEQKSGVDIMERILAMRTQLLQEKAKEGFDRALAAFQSECPIIEKKRQVMNKGGMGVRYSYAPLDSILCQVRGLLQKHGFSFTFNAVTDDKGVTATCKVTHVLGHSSESTFRAGIDVNGFMNEPQKFASALTFAKRYAFCSAFGILTGDEDDDASKAGKDPATAEQEARWQAKPEPAKDPNKERLRPLWELLKPIRGEKASWEQAEKWLEAHKIWAGDVRKIPDSAMIDVLDKAQIALTERNLL